MARTTSRGLYVFDLTTDLYDHTKVAANWDLIDSLFGVAPQSVQTLAAVPAVGNFAGRLVMLSAADSGFGAWTLIRFDGSSWRTVGYEILPAVPSSGNYAGRLVVLSASSGAFNAWDVIRYDGSSWSIVGGFQSVNTGSGALNIKGLTTTGDVQFSDSGRGIVLKDRSSGNYYRLYISSGGFFMELVS